MVLVTRKIEPVTVGEGVREALADCGLPLLDAKRAPVDALRTLRNKYPRALGAGHDDVGEVDEAGPIVELEGNRGGTRRGQTGSRELRVSGKVWDVFKLHDVLSIPFDPEMTRLPGIIKPKREGTSGGCRGN